MIEIHCKDCGVEVDHPRDGRCDDCIQKAYLIPNRTKPMKFFLDLGYNRGQGLRDFIGQLNITEFWEVHTWEPEPNLNRDLPEVMVMPVSGAVVMVHKEACWVRDGLMTLRIDEADEGGSTLFKDSTMGGLRGAERDVRTIDFIRWMRDNTSSDDDIYIKMDIEGAEFPILRGMLDEGAVDLFGRIRKMWVEFHQRFLPGEDDNSKARLVEEVSKHTKISDHG